MVFPRPKPATPQHEHARRLRHRPRSWSTPGITGLPENGPEKRLKIETFLIADERIVADELHPIQQVNG